MPEEFLVCAAEWDRGGREREGDMESRPNTMCSMNHEYVAASGAEPKASVR